MTSKLTRERLFEIAEDGFLKHGESKELARMALAAMDSSESVELPLDYLQGHKDGLEWAAQLAETNHPETGDWLYDDPIDLAKAIRKGPDMPPVQPVADSDPVAEVVSIYGNSEAFGEREIRPLVGIQQMPYGTKLYRHAQPVPEYPEVLPCSVLLDPGLRFGKGIKTSTMLAALARRDVYESDLAALSPEERAEFQVGIEDVKALIAQSTPVMPDGYVMVPKDLLSELRDLAHPEIEKYCEMWEGRRDSEFPALRKVITDADALLAAAPQEVKSEL